MMGAWMDLKTRKLTGLINQLLRTFSGLEKAVGFSVLTKEDTRKYSRNPKNL
jgi:acyl-CoA thioester hydrolase